MKTILPITIIFLLLSSLSFSQNYRFDWAKSYKSTQDNIDIRNTITDTNGNYYTIGNFSDSVDIDNTSSSYYLNSNGYSDFFIIKHNADNSLAWAKQIGPQLGTVYTSARSNAIDIAIDPANNSIYIIGDFIDSVDFNPDTLNTEIQYSTSRANSYFQTQDSH